MIPRQAAHHRPAGKGLGAGLLLVLWMGAVGPGSNRAWAHTQGMYSTRAAAEKRATELHCQGAYPMGDRWGTDGCPAPTNKACTKPCGNSSRKAPHGGRPSALV